MQKRILVIGTDPGLAHRLETHAPLDGCKVEACPGNVEAVVRLRSRSYEVIVTDPDTTCHEDLVFLAETARLRPGVRVVARAPSTAPQDVILAMRRRVFAGCLPLVARRHEISRWQGGFFLAFYVAYVLYLILAAKQHQSLEWFSAVMLEFVIPLVAACLIALVYAHRVRPGVKGS